MLYLGVTLYILSGLFNIKIYNDDTDKRWAKTLKRWCFGYSKLSKLVVFLLGFFPAIFFFLWGVLALVGTFISWVRSSSS